jgi:hypothetical protein
MQYCYCETKETSGKSLHDGTDNCLPNNDANCQNSDRSAATLSGATEHAKTLALNVRLHKPKYRTDFDEI